MLDKYYDSDTGITEFIETDGDVARVHSMQDVTSVVERCKAYANEGMTDQGIKDGMWHYADVPLSILLEIKDKYGVNMFRPTNDDWKRFFSIIESDYPLLKLTQKKHQIRHHRVSKEIILP